MRCACVHWGRLPTLCLRWVGNTDAICKAGRDSRNLLLQKKVEPHRLQAVKNSRHNRMAVFKGLSCSLFFAAYGASVFSAHLTF